MQLHKFFLSVLYRSCISQQTRKELRHIEDILEDLTTLLVQVLSLPGIELPSMQLTRSLELASWVLVSEGSLESSLQYPVSSVLICEGLRKMLGCRIFKHYRTTGIDSEESIPYKLSPVSVFVKQVTTQDLLMPFFIRVLRGHCSILGAGNICKIFHT